MCLNCLHDPDGDTVDQEVAEARDGFYLETV
jgi:hypothetical protein